MTRRGKRPLTPEEATKNAPPEHEHDYERDENPNESEDYERFEDLARKLLATPSDSV